MFRRICLSVLNSPARNQFISVFIVNLIVLSHGCILGWFSPALYTLTSPKNPFKDDPWNPDQISWLANITSISSVLGAVLSGLFVSRFGFRITLICMAFPQITWWSLVRFGERYPVLLAARAIAGITGGAYYCVVSQYTAHVAHKRIRGMCGVMSPIMYKTGVLIGYILGNNVRYDLLYLSVILPLAYIPLILMFIPETPSYLLNKGKDDEAMKSLKYYRTVTSGNAPQWCLSEFYELRGMKLYMKGRKRRLSWKTYLSKEAHFGLSLCIVLSILYHFSGTNSLSNFASTILVQPYSTMNPIDASSLIVGIQILGGILAFILIDCVGRKVLMLASCLGTAATLGTLGIYLYFVKHCVDVGQTQWVPTLLYTVALFMVSLGIGTAPFTVHAEILPPEIRNVGLTIAATIIAASGALVTNMLSLLNLWIDLYGILWVFALSSFAGFAVSAIFLRETKGTDLHKVE